MASALIISCTSRPQYPQPGVKDGEVRIRISDVRELSPQFHTVIHDGKRYDFFIQSKDGEIEAYVDACIKCSPQKKGFRAEEKSLVCNACGERYPLSALQGVGSCHPIPLPGRESGEIFIISLDDILRKTRNPL